MIEVSFGSNASFDASGSDFRYHPERRHLLALQYLTKRANNGLMHRSKQHLYSITSPPRSGGVGDP
jgi:hypothetical protein